MFLSPVWFRRSLQPLRTRLKVHRWQHYTCARSTINHSLSLIARRRGHSQRMVRRLSSGLCPLCGFSDWLTEVKQTLRATAKTSQRGRKRRCAYKNTRPRQQVSVILCLCTFLHCYIVSACVRISSAVAYKHWRCSEWTWHNLSLRRPYLNNIYMTLQSHTFGKSTCKMLFCMY